ncbi:MAG: redoxin family protein [Chitinophagaceae bacterium]|nr:redoxin family protein [Chitinophagaceae bacterium]MCZ2395693.1 TlpA family protein disulfide reductase [Chitinophagales bacterium]
MKLLSIALLLFSGSLYGQMLAPGNYRWQIQRNDGQAIIFNTQVLEDGKKFLLINGTDSLLVENISRKDDSIYIELPFYESAFMVKPDAAHNLRGEWIKSSAGVPVLRMPVIAEYGNRTRFPASKKARYNVTGEWATTFTDEKKESKAGGEFVQNGNYITGTFRTPYGDYRFLQGIVSGDSISLSGFDGSMALLFKGKIYRKKIVGKMYSRNSDALDWRSDKGQVDLPDNLTKIKPDAGKVSFTFPDTDGNPVSINDDRYKNKVVVLQIMGSWCPNCLDEMQFIIDNYKRYEAMGVEFIALAYERTDNFRESQKALQPFLKKFDIPYPILIPPVSVADEDKTEKTIPQIDNIVAFPTTIFINKSGYIVKVHNGFDGPATGIHFTRYKEEFEQTLKALSAQ